MREVDYEVTHPEVVFCTTAAAMSAQLKHCEIAARTCYASESKTGDEVDGKFMGMLIGKHHESVLEHAVCSVIITTDRATSHQLVRHRLAAYSQQSDRYIRHSGEGKKGLKFIYPMHFATDTKEEQVRTWIESVERAAAEYTTALEEWKWKPEEARIFLPHSLATKICVTANVREWRHIFKMRLSKAAMPSIRAVIYPVYDWLRASWPWLVEDIEVCPEAESDTELQAVYIRSYSAPDRETVAAFSTTFSYRMARLGVPNELWDSAFTAICTELGIDYVDSTATIATIEEFMRNLQYWPDEKAYSTAADTAWTVEDLKKNYTVLELDGGQFLIHKP